GDDDRRRADRLGGRGALRRRALLGRLPRDRGRVRAVRRTLAGAARSDGVAGRARSRVRDRPPGNRRRHRPDSEDPPRGEPRGDDRLLERARFIVMTDVTRFALLGHPADYDHFTRLMDGESNGRRQRLMRHERTFAKMVEWMPSYATTHRPKLRLDG